MIDYALIYALSDQLEALRTSGMLVFDTRDQGNYGTYTLADTWALLEKEDPTGIAAALLLAEMLEATLHLSKVKLPRVLLEPDFVEQLKALLVMRKQLADVTDAPRGELTTRLSDGLRSISETFGTVDRRELAICLRDALYSLSQGLTLRWVACNPEAPASTHLPLANQVEQHATVSDFVEALRDQRPFGAYLGVIGSRHQTVIGIKQACGTAYLSSGFIDTNNGQMGEHRAHNYHMAEALDLDKVTERYPEWYKLRPARSSGTGHELQVTELPALTLADLPRDRVLWLALVVEMARQRMSQLAPKHPALAETLTRALPAPATTLPAVIRNWSLRTPTLAEAVEALGLTPWARKQCEAAWKGRTATDFLPQGESPMGMVLETGELVPWRNSSDCWGYPGGYDQFAAQHVALCPVSAGLVGTQEELETARRTILLRNVQAYATAWVNERIVMFWLTEGHAWFQAQLARRVPEALSDPCTRIQTSDGPLVTHFCKESAKHKTFHARCWFNAKLVPDLWAVISPKNSADLTRLLGLASEAELPEILQGWERLPNQHLQGTQRVYWAWNKLHDGYVYERAQRLKVGRGVPTEGFMLAKVSLNTASVPGLAPTPASLRSELRDDD